MMHKSSNVQFIEQQGHKAFAVIPYDEYVKLIEKDEPGIPHEVVGMVIKKNMTLLKAWRKYLGKTQKEIAQAAGLSQAAVSQMEKTENPRTETLEKLAKAMGLEVSQLEDV
jgi:DNA-binding XRE family transcriptional regulator